MSTPVLVRDFYARIWDAGDEAAAADLLTENFTFHDGLIAGVRVLRDIAGLEAVLHSNSVSSP